MSINSDTGSGTVPDEEDMGAGDDATAPGQPVFRL
jgi:hypothetical protein